MGLKLLVNNYPTSLYDCTCWVLDCLNESNTIDMLYCCSPYAYTKARANLPPFLFARRARKPGIPNVAQGIRSDREITCFLFCMLKCWTVLDENFDELSQTSSNIHRLSSSNTVRQSVTFLIVLNVSCTAIVLIWTLLCSVAVVNFKSRSSLLRTFSQSPLHVYVP